MSVFKKTQCRVCRNWFYKDSVSCLHYCSVDCENFQLNQVKKLNELSQKLEAKRKEDLIEIRKNKALKKKQKKLKVKQPQTKLPRPEEFKIDDIPLEYREHFKSVKGKQKKRRLLKLFKRQRNKFDSGRERLIKTELGFKKTVTFVSPEIQQQTFIRRAAKQFKTPNGFYETREWQELRYRAIRKYGRTCMCCGKTEGEMHVDHIKPRSKYPELELDFNNLQILCRDCNLGKSNLDDTDFRPKEKKEFSKPIPDIFSF